VSAHEEFSPSSLPHLQACPGWRGGLPSADASRGTDIDKTITDCIRGDVVDIPEEIQDQVSYAADVLEEVREWVGFPADEFTQRFLPGLIPGTGGYADFVAVNEFDGNWIAGSGGGP